jgi:hypothetical protein
MFPKLKSGLKAEIQDGVQDGRQKWSNLIKWHISTNI